MAEFQEVMRQLNRMCSNYSTCGAECPIVDECGTLGSYSSFQQRSKDIEKAVMGWAEEHPEYHEPTYPTWIEWLKSMGVVPYMTGLVVTRGADDGHFHDGHINITAKALEAIPADIARRLGIKPKEGV